MDGSFRESDVHRDHRGRRDGDRPPPAVARPVRGVGEWRVRTGDYRVVYEIHDDVLLVLVLAVGHRREVYRAR